MFLVAGCASLPPGDAAPARPSVSIPLEILKPDGAGPFPAVVLLHDCSGLGPRSSGAPRRWARELLARRYVVAIPDSFSTRGFAGGVCTEASPTRAEVGPFRRVRDAYETLDHLRTLPYVDGSRVGVMGGSHGGSSTLVTLAASNNVVSKRVAPGFKAGVALYPACAIGNPRFTTSYQPVAPLLILTGELDDWTPAQPCRELAAAADPTRGKVTLKVYPGAHHSFDSSAPLRFNPNRNNVNATGGRGATTAGNAEAWADSIREVTAFFARELGSR
ncbi:MAG TPA: dienelactone hydrolase family protein [Usitatibacter sp.]|nr:dienelactone hydrolase family protein [Usitatibacter sp.]